MCVNKYLHFGFLGPRDSKWQSVCITGRLGKEVRIEVVLVLVFEYLKKKRPHKYAHNKVMTHFYKSNFSKHPSEGYCPVLLNDDYAYNDDIKLNFL